MNKIKAPIDNKNICEWFTEAFHSNNYIEQVEDKVTKQVFYLCECLCEVSYRFGQNWFRVRIIEGSPDNVRQCSAKIDSIIKSINDDNNESKVQFNPVVGIYEFYFVEL